MQKLKLDTLIQKNGCYSNLYLTRKHILVSKINQLHRNKAGCEFGFALKSCFHKCTLDQKWSRCSGRVTCENANVSGVSSQLLTKQNNAWWKAMCGSSCMPFNYKIKLIIGHVTTDYKNVRLHLPKSSCEVRTNYHITVLNSRSQTKLTVEAHHS